MENLKDEVKREQAMIESAINISNEIDDIDAEIKKLNGNIRKAQIMALIMGVVTVVVLVARVIA